MKEEEEDMVGGSEKGGRVGGAKGGGEDASEVLEAREDAGS